jgi:hypothetical protein
MKNAIGGILFDILILIAIIWLVNKFNPNLVQSTIKYITDNERR